MTGSNPYQQQQVNMSSAISFAQLGYQYRVTPNNMELEEENKATNPPIDCKVAGDWVVGEGGEVEFDITPPSPVIEKAGAAAASSTQEKKEKEVVYLVSPPTYVDLTGREAVEVIDLTEE